MTFLNQLSTASGVFVFPVLEQMDLCFQPQSDPVEQIVVFEKSVSAGKSPDAFSNLSEKRAR